MTTAPAAGPGPTGPGPTGPRAPITRNDVIIACHLISGYLLGFALLSLVLHSPRLALACWAINLPVSAVACACLARAAGRSLWLGLLCAPCAPFAATLLKRLLRRDGAEVRPAQETRM